MRICFVCLGNICRSPAAEAVAAHLLAGRDDLPDVELSSAGTGPWHVGALPHTHTRAEAARRGIPVDHRGYQISPADFGRFDLLVAMDGGNVADLHEMAPDRSQAAKVVRLGAFAPGGDGARWAGDDGRDVPDPFGDIQQAFARMFDQLEPACAGLLDWVASGSTKPPR
ncbi:MAG: low molecular weight protein-tyrosine-phosphatase [Ornithinimicrobium sp.]